MRSRAHSLLSRRAVNTMLAVIASSSIARRSLAQSVGQALTPFRVNIPQGIVERILGRVRDAQWPDKLDASDWRYGANWDYMKALAQYWIEQFEWRKAEANLNRYPQFLARVGDYDIHFYHVKGTGPKPVPLILTHGWPGSVFEFLEAIGPLSDPVRSGGAAEDAFDVIIPSLPGFGFSSKPEGKPIGPRATAGLWHRLMTEVLGYPKYGAQGGDWGSVVTAQLARLYPDSILGIHLNGAQAGPPAAEQTADEQAWRKELAAFSAAELDYLREQRNKPQTVAFALSDNPLGTAAWIVEKLKVWSNSSNETGLPFTMDQILTNVMLYLVTNTAGSVNRAR
jgi:pimeloyl-ACP methyl ester carboxylesterase